MVIKYTIKDVKIYDAYKQSNEYRKHDIALAIIEIDEGQFLPEQHFIMIEMNDELMSQTAELKRLNQ